MGAWASALLGFTGFLLLLFHHRGTSLRSLGCNSYSIYGKWETSVGYGSRLVVVQLAAFFLAHALLFSPSYLLHTRSLRSLTHASFFFTSPSPPPRSLRSLARFFLFTLLHVHILLLAALACTLPFLFTHFHLHTSATFCTAAGEGIFCGLGSYSAEAVGQFPIFFLSVVTTIVYMGF